MAFERDRLTDPMSYFESEGLRLTGPRNARWKTTSCAFHGGSDSMRVNTSTGAWVCMSCGAKGGDVLAYHMQLHGLDFVPAAQALGAWVGDEIPVRPPNPTALSPRAALEVLGFESTLVAVAAGNVAVGRVLSDADSQRLLICANRILRIVGDYA